MKTKEINTIVHRNIAKRLFAWAVFIAAILMMPLLANAPWTGSDFVFAGAVLFGCAITYELATKNMSSLKHKAAVGLAVLFFIFMVMGWAAAGP